MNGNGGGGGEGGGAEEQMEVEEDGGGGAGLAQAAAAKERVVFMWGYLPGVSPQRSPLLGPVPVRLPAAAGGDGWRDVCGGGCGFAMAISESGKLLTWGSADDMGQSYMTAGKHEETPEAFPLPSDVAITPYFRTARADNICVNSNFINAMLDQMEGMFIHGVGKNVFQQGGYNKGNSITVSPRSQVSRTSSGAASGPSESRDLGQVWGWGYGGEGQLGLGSRIRTVSSPHPIPCIESALYSKDRPAAMKGNKTAEAQISKVMGNFVKSIACGGRHSAVITGKSFFQALSGNPLSCSFQVMFDIHNLKSACVNSSVGRHILFWMTVDALKLAVLVCLDSGALLTFGWGLYGQCGQGNTDDVLSPTCVSSILGVKMQDIGAGLWHTVCTSVDGDVYSFGGNQFGQLGTGSDQAETVPKLVDASSLENKNARTVSCGARHSAIMTDEGEVFCWGWNKYGQLGLGDSMDRNVPCSVPVDAYHPLNVSCGWWHTLVLAESPT
uniref:Ultraviolet-B receptor UVR8 n=1 Tax=Leersia perrieri TaxID=77586 RepID=A0A0D9V7R5_9ORYZ